MKIDICKKCNKLLYDNDFKEYYCPILGYFLKDLNENNINCEKWRIENEDL